MFLKASVLALALLCASCAEPVSEPGLKALVGGRLELSPTAEAIPFSVIIIAGGKIRAAGPQATTPVPKGAETISTKGRIIRPWPDGARISPGEPASFTVLNAATGEPDSVMQDGQWVDHHLTAK